MQVMPETTYESMSAGPATLCAAAPVATKMPAPMIAPIPRLVSWTGPRTRRSRFSPFISSRSMASGLRANSWLAIRETSVRRRQSLRERREERLEDLLATRDARHPELRRTRVAEDVDRTVREVGDVVARVLVLA